MTNMIKYEDWAKLELRIGQVIEIEENKIKINCNSKSYSVNLDLNVEIKDKIIVGIEGDQLVIPIIQNSMPLIPDKDIEVGSRVG